MVEEVNKDEMSTVSGDPYSLATQNDLDAAEMNERSHATQQLSKEEMHDQRTAARNMISGIFTDGNSVQMARSIISSQFPSMAGELDNLIDREKVKHGNVPETQAEADQRKAEEAAKISSALLGGAGLSSFGQEPDEDKGPTFSFSSLFGSNSKYLAGPSALLPAAAFGAISAAEELGSTLSRHVEDILALDASPSAQSPTLGIPSIQRDREQARG